MIIENIYQAKTHLSRLVDEVLEGKDVVIARSGRYLDFLEAVDGQVEVGGRKFSRDEMNER